MKRFYTITALFVFMLVMAAYPAYAGVWDTIKGWGAGLPWAAAAMILTGVIAIGGMATRAKWMSGVLMSVGVLINSIGAIPYNVGVALQDGKIESDELKAMPADYINVKTQFMAVVSMIKKVK